MIYILYIASIAILVVVLAVIIKSTNKKMFDNNDVYKSIPKFKFWLPGLCFSILCGFLTYAIIFNFYTTSGGMGYALFFVVPISFGSILGYTTKSIRLWWVVCLSMTAIASISFAITYTDMTGIFCGLTLGAVFLGPVLLGVTLGWILRQFVLRYLSKKYNFVPVLILFVAPLLCGYAENKHYINLPPVTVQTSYVFEASKSDTWNQIRFYEEIEGEAPLLLKLGLPNPIGIEGNHRAVGELTKCEYHNGYIIKEITDIEDGKLLSFDVVEQNIHFERDVTLIDGSFELESIDDNNTKVTLTTRYQSHIRPLWLWQPMEREVIKTLHSYVMEDMRRDLKEKSSDE